MRCSLLIVALCLAACAVAEEGKDEASEGKRKEKEAVTLSNGQVWVQVRGCARVSRKTILGLIQTKTGDRFDREKWEGDRQRLIDTGFFVSVTMGGAAGLPGATVLTIDVVEHPAVNAIKIEAKGVRKLPKDASPDLGLKEDEMLVAGKLEAARAALAAAYAKAGTAVRVEARTETRSTRRQFINNQWETWPDTVDVVFEVRAVAVAAADTMVSIPGSAVLKEAEQGK